jgi:DNA-directed RNA polymerase specialized sigma24 family protein
MRYYLDLTVAEASEHLGWPEGTVKTLTRAALTSLRRMAEVDEED